MNGTSDLVHPAKREFFFQFVREFFTKIHYVICCAAFTAAQVSPASGFDQFEFFAALLAKQFRFSSKRERDMPANLPPPYFEAEKRYREGKTPEEKIEALEEMLTIMPKHKGTDKLRADLRKRIAKHKSDAQQKKGSAKGVTAYSIEREGAAQVIIVGVPNVGKSSIVAALTNAKPEVADFPHTTWKPTPGMANFENIQFQLIDTPPVPTEFIDPGLTDLLRRTDIIVVVDRYSGRSAPADGRRHGFSERPENISARNTHCGGLEKGPVHKEDPAAGKQGR